MQRTLAGGALNEWMNSPQIHPLAFGRVISYIDSPLSAQETPL
jgi:hypothetical protein